MQKKHSIDQLKPFTLWRCIANYLASYPLAGFFLIFFSFFWAFTLPYMSYLLGVIIDTLTQAHTRDSIWNAVAIPTITVISIHVLRSIGYYINGLFCLKTLPHAKANMMKALFSYLSSQSSRYFQDNLSGHLTSKVMNAMQSLEPVLTCIFNTLLPQFLTILIAGVFLTFVAPYFGVIFWVWAIILITFTYHQAKKGHVLSRNYSRSNSKLTGKLTDVLTNIQNVIYNATQSEESNRLRTPINTNIHTDQALQSHLNRLNLVNHLAMNLLRYSNLLLLILCFIKGLISLGTFVFVINTVRSVSSVIIRLGESYLTFTKNLGQLKEGLEILDARHEINDLPGARRIHIQDGSITIKNLTFHYPNQPALFKNFTLHIPAKQKVGIIGRSGCGKTTLLHLILRLYATQKGSISIDGIDISTITRTSLRQQIAIVPQHLPLFHRSIFDNIKYGTRTIDESDIINIAKQTSCHEFIKELPKKYHTKTGEQGVKLSGGQRQRVAIARALLKNTPIVLLDEATSALDSLTEDELQKNLDALLENKTALIVAHRLSTLKKMERILVLDDGKIVEDGTHEALLNKNGLYTQLWNSQVKGFIQTHKQ